MSLSIATKIRLAIGAILIVFLAVCGYTVARNHVFATDTAASYRADVEAAVGLSKTQSAIWEQRDLLGQFARDNAERRALLRARDRQLTNTVQAFLAAYGVSGIGEMETRALRQLQEAYTAYVEARPGWFALVEADKTEEAQNWRNERVTPHGTEVAKRLAQLVEQAQDVAAGHLVSVQESSTRTRAGIATLSVAGFVILVALAVWLSYAVITPLHATRAMLEAIAEGEADLSRRAREDRRDEFGAIARAFNKTMARFHDVIARVRGNGAVLQSAAGEISTGAASLAYRVEEQAAGLEETAASMEELSASVGQNADAAQKADGHARAAATQAKRGGDEAESAVTMIAELSRSAGRIGEIVSVIDGIAFQTNILALNAAVEAARAGESGRGFAVVAAEVRALAHRSATAAKEVKALIDDSVRQVGDGQRLVEQAGNTIRSLAATVHEVSVLMSSIAAASTEQSRGVRQVSETVSQMDRMLQENAKAVQSASAGAERMDDLARDLMAVVEPFRLDASAVPAPAELPNPSVPALAPVVELRRLYGS